MNKREKVKKPEGSKTHRFLWIGLLIFIALIFACVGFSYRSIRQKLNGVADAAMMETADENAAMLQMTLESRFELMDDVGRKIAEDPEGAQDILTYLGEYANGYGFKRLCYMDATGWTISSDGKSGDFSFRTYFRRSMDGQYSITGKINDRLGQSEPVHVMSAPVRDPQTGEVIGVTIKNIWNCSPAGFSNGWNPSAARDAAILWNRRAIFWPPRPARGLPRRAICWRK